MSRLQQIICLMAASVAVGLADSLLKKIGQGGSFFGAIRSPWFFAALALYLVQILFFVYLFVKRWELGIVGIVQNMLYALVILTVGWLVYKERLSPAQIAGAALALLGIALMES